MALQATIKETVFRVGDTIRVFYRIIEREKLAGKTKKSVEEKIKERIQPFEGLVIGIKGKAENKSFTVRRIADKKIGVERVFPIISPWIEKIEVVQRGVVRRAKLNYLKRRGNLEVKTILPVSSKKAKKIKAAKNATKTEKPAKKSTAKSAGPKGRTAGSKVSSK